MKTIPFSLEEWLKDDSRQVLDNNGNPVEIVTIQLSPAFYGYVPKGVNPAECYTYHFHIRREGIDKYPVIGNGVMRNYFIVER